MTEDPNRIPDDEVDRVLAEQKRARIVRQRNLVLIVGSALVVLLLVALVIWRLKRSATEAETDVTPVVSVKVVKAEKQTIAAPVSAVGTIWPREKADVAAKISAQIKKMALLKNKVVHAGEVIAGHLPLQAGSASVIHAILGAMLLTALQRAGRRSPASGGPT